MLRDKSYNLLLVEDSPGDADLTQEVLSDVPGYSFSTTLVQTLKAATEEVSKKKFDAAILDLSLPDSSGLHTLRQFNAAAGDQIPIVVLSGNESEEMRQDAMVEGAQDYLCKSSQKLFPLLLSRSILFALERQRTLNEQQQVERLVSSNPDAVIVANKAGVIRFVNESATILFERSRDDFIGEHFRFSLEPGTMTQIEITSKKEKRTAEMRVAELEWRREPVFLASIRDITDRIKLTNQLRHAQKMEALGQLAGGVAHDFNNLLTVINGYSEILASDWTGDEDNLVMLNEIHRAGVRASALTQQLLAFGRKSLVTHTTLNLNKCVEDTERMLRRLVGADISFTKILDPSLGSISADPTCIEQVIMNLIVNASDAMPEGGELLLETQNIHLAESYADPYASIGPGWYVRLSISDDGIGMDAETMSHIFEPFFTTKEKGKGTGLGLATIYGIIKQAGGHITVYSEPGTGTTFKVLFPMLSSKGEADVAPDAPQNRVVVGNETVLVVEDEPGVRDYIIRILSLNGYKVLTASNGTHALEVARDHPGEIHVLLTDVVMPGMGGWKLSEELTNERPDIKILFMSGYTDEAIIRRGMFESSAFLLQKPFTPSALTIRIREILDGTTSRG